MAHCAVVTAEQTKWVVLSCLDVNYNAGQDVDPEKNRKSIFLLYC